MLTPMFWADDNSAMISELTLVTRCRRRRLGVTGHIYLVSSALSWSLFVRIQIRISFVHAEIRDAKSSIPLSKQRPKTCVSSAKTCVNRPWLSIILIKYGVYLIKSISPRNDPWEIPLETMVKADALELQRFRLRIYDSNQWRSMPVESVYEM